MPSLASATAICNQLRRGGVGLRPGSRVGAIRFGESGGRIGGGATTPCGEEGESP